MIVRHIEPTFQDERGSIEDILENEELQHATIIRSAAGAVRGNHYHEHTWQWVFVISGAIRYVVRGEDDEVQSGVVRTNDLLLTGPKESHALETLEDTVMLVLTRGPRGGSGYEGDTFRLAEPLIPR
jgi:dTDP-4-dehydrorhamnose 3,5-epimerase-like enzyme